MCLTDLYVKLLNHNIAHVTYDAAIAGLRFACFHSTCSIGRNRNLSLSRYDSVLINRLRIGHTRLTHSYLLKGENQPECQICHSPLTVKHILIDCICFSAARQRYLGVETLSFLKLWSLETSLLLLKIQTFFIVYNVLIFSFVR